MAAYKPWHDKGYLHKMYVQNRKTIDEIAEDCTKMGYAVTPMTIFNNLKKFELLKNSRTLGKRRVTSDPNKGGKGKGFYG